jgi:hypothetical protein
MGVRLTADIFATVTKSRHPRRDQIDGPLASGLSNKENEGDDTDPTMLTRFGTLIRTRPTIEQRVELRRMYFDTDARQRDSWRTMAKRKNKTMTEVLRNAIVESGLPLLTLGKGSGVDRASLRRFVNGKRSVRLDMADKLAEYFQPRLCESER